MKVFTGRLSNLLKGWQLIDEESDIRRIKRLTSHQLRQLVSKKDRINMPQEKVLRNILIPYHVQLKLQKKQRR